MIRFFALHPTAANLLMLLLLAVGAASLPALQRETFPDFTPQEVAVRVPWPGASPGEVEEAVCRRIEDAVDGIAGVAELRCEAREGLAVAVVEMREGGDMARFLDDVKTEVEAVDDFPAETETAVVQQRGRTDEVVSVAVTGPMTTRDLKAYARELKDRMQQLGPISQVEIQGFSDHQLRVEVDAAALQRHGLSLERVADAVRRQSVDLPAGSVETREREILVRFTDQRRSPRELAALIVVGAEAGGEVRLGDLATITDRFELEEDRLLFDGRRAAQLRVTKTRAEDALVVRDAVAGFLEAERRRAPPGVSLTLTQDRSSIVRDRLEMLLVNAAQGLVLVFLSMWLFFQLRFSFWVTMGLPVSFLGGLFFMALIGYSINMITMVALLIALGLLMDDAIVIAENVATHLRRGRPALQAAVDGTREVLPGVLSSFLTTTAVFGPLAFLAGDMGKVLGVIPVVLIGVLAVSLVEAFLILPRHLGHALARGVGEAGRFRRGFDRRFEWVREAVLGRAVDTVVRWRYLFVGAVVAVFLVSVGLLAGGVLKFQAFPDLDGDTIEARLLLPQGTPLARTEAVVERVVAALAAVDAELTPLQPDGQALVRHVSVQFNHNPDAHESGAHVATVKADLLDAELRRAGIDEVVSRWRETVGALPDVLALNFKEPGIGPAGLAIDIRLSGPDLAALDAAARELEAWLQRYRGVVDLSRDLRPGKPEFRLRLKEGTLGLGLDAATVAGQLRAAFFGTTASEIQVGPESYEIDVRLEPADRDGLDDLETFRVLTPAGELVPLESIAEIEAGRGYARIHRIDGQRTVTLQGEVDTRLANVREVIADTAARFLPDLRARYPSVRVALEGQSAETATTGASLARGFALGLLGIFILLSFQFRSYIEPVVVMTAIPLALIGVVWGHLAMGLELSMPSMMGAVSLAGIVVNDSILLVQFLKRRAGGGLAVTDAARQASRDRFRAVLLTSLTTIAGLLPLLAERSLQAQVLIPLATSIVFGLAASTVLVLLLVPCLYSILDDLGLSTVARQEGVPPRDASTGQV